MNNSLTSQIIFELLHHHKLVWKTTNNQCFYTPLTFNPIFPYLFYMNEAKLNHNEVIKMYIYCVHKMNIMIHALSHFSYKVTQISWLNCKQPHDGTYLLPNHIYFIIHLYLFIQLLILVHCLYIKMMFYYIIKLKNTYITFQ